MAFGQEGTLRGVVQTAEQGGGFVWVIALVDFSAGHIKRTIVSEDNFATEAAAKDAGEATLKGLAEDK